MALSYSSMSKSALPMTSFSRRSATSLPEASLMRDSLQQDKFSCPYLLFLRDSPSVQHTTYSFACTLQPISIQILQMRGQGNQHSFGRAARCSAFIL